MSLIKAIQFCCEHHGSIKIECPELMHEATVRMVVEITCDGTKVFNEGFAAVGYAFEPVVLLDCLADRLVSSIKEKMSYLNGVEKGKG